MSDDMVNNFTTLCKEIEHKQTSMKVIPFSPILAQEMDKDKELSVISEVKDSSFKISLLGCKKIYESNNSVEEQDELINLNGETSDIPKILKNKYEVHYKLNTKYIHHLLQTFSSIFYNWRNLVSTEMYSIDISKGGSPISEFTPCYRVEVHLTNYGKFLLLRMD